MLLALRPTQYLHTIVSWFGLEAERPLMVTLDSADCALLMSLPSKSHFITAQMLYALWETGNRDLTTHTEPENDHLEYFVRIISIMSTSYYWQIRTIASDVIIYICTHAHTRTHLPNSPRSNYVWELGGARCNLHCDWLKKHEFFMSGDGVGTSGHVLQTEWSVFFG